MPDSGAIAFIAGQISELFLSSRQDKEHHGDLLRVSAVSRGKFICVFK